MSDEAAVRTVDGRDVVWEPQPRQDIALRCPALELCYGGSKGGGKLLCVASEVPTPTGWKKNGDLVAGDEVIGEDGKPLRVIVAHPPLTQQAWRLHFSDGTSIVAGEDHLWRTKTAKDRDREVKLTPEWRAARRARRPSRATGNGLRKHVAAVNSARKHEYLPPPTGSVRTTKEIVDTLRVKRGVVVANHSIDQHSPLCLPEADLIIPPYTLGAWLGDGHKGSGQITGLDEEIFERIERDGFTVSRQRVAKSRYILGFTDYARRGGVLRDKHIPVSYLRASASQRLALLHGLMDTDGWCERDGSCKIALCRKELFDGVVELIRTLGIIVNVSHGFKTATNGSEGNSSETWTACFVTSLPAFGLARKLKLQNRNPHVRYTRRFVVAADPVGPVEMRCITVANPNGMYLAGRQMIPTHNTDLLVIACIWQIMLCHEKWIKTGRKQRGRYIIFRRNLKNLQDIIQRAEEIYPSIDPNATRPTQQKNWWTFESGYRVEFAHLDGPDDHKGYNGQELTGVGFDQVEEIPEHVYLFLRMQVRSKDPDMRKLLFVRCTANPGGPYAQWVKDYFVNGCKPHNTIIKSQVKLRGGKVRETTKAFVPATLYDNKYLAEDGAYEATLMSLPEHLRRMYLEGDWDVVVGAYFAHVWKRSIHVIPSFPIPGSWPVKFGLDWGTSAPSCTLWAAKDNDGNIYFIDELYRPGITGRTYGEAMLKKLEAQKWSSEKRWGVKDMYGLIDRQAMAATGSDGAGPSTPAAGIQWCGWRVFPANKDRAASIEQWLERLLLKPNGKPSVYIFGDRCPKLASTMSQLMADPHNPNDVDSSGDDHAFDASRFVLMDWPVNDPRKKQNKGDADVERWLEMARKRKDADEMSDYTQSTGYGD